MDAEQRHNENTGEKDIEGDLLDAATAKSKAEV